MTKTITILAITAIILTGIVCSLCQHEKRQTFEYNNECLQTPVIHEGI